jgi:hypothetical protein
MAAETGVLLAGLSAAGLLQNLYFYGIDFHFSLVCTPLILVIVVWISTVQNPSAAREIPRPNRWIFGMAVLISVWLCAVQIRPWFSAGLRNSLFYQLVTNPAPEISPAFRNPYSFAPSDNSVSALVALLEKYAGDERDVAVFVHHDDQTEALLLTGKTHVLGLSDPAMRPLSRSFSAHVLDLAARKAGTPGYIFFDSTYGAQLDVQRNAFEIPASAGRYSVMDMKGGILVYRRGE